MKSIKPLLGQAPGAVRDRGESKHPEEGEGRGREETTSGGSCAAATRKIPYTHTGAATSIV
mgnify:CR=1 FL=1